MMHSIHPYNKACSSETCVQTKIATCQIRTLLPFSLAEPSSLFTIFLRMVLVLPSFRFFVGKKIIIATRHKFVCVELPKNRAQHVVHFFLIFWGQPLKRVFFLSRILYRWNLIFSHLFLYVASADSCICMYSLFF